MRERESFKTAAVDMSTCSKSSHSLSHTLAWIEEEAEPETTVFLVDGGRIFPGFPRMKK